MTIDEFLECYSRITSHGWLEMDEAMLLVYAAEKTKGPMIEVGCYQGRSAMLLAQLGRELHCIDPWDNHFHSDLTGDEIFKKFLLNISSLPVWADVGYVRSKVEYVKPFPAEFVYLDGDHTYEGTLAQCRFAKACGAKVIAVHDVEDKGGGAEVARAAIEVLGPYTQKVRRLAVWE